MVCWKINNIIHLYLFYIVIIFDPVFAMDIGEDVKNVYIINIPKPRILAKRSSQLIKPHINTIKINKRVRKPSEVSLTKYALPGEKPVAVSTLEKDVLLSYVQYAKKQHINRLKQRLAINIYDKFKVININLRKRLHVDDPLDDVHAITDIDKGFYKYVDGRPLRNSIPLYKSLKFLFHNQLRMRQEIGYRKDAILHIKTSYEKEHQTYGFAIKRCTNQAKYLDKFISDDYEKSMVLLKKWEILKLDVHFKNIELYNLATEIFTIKSRLVGLEFKYCLQQKYGRFLYYLSPPIWRAHHRDFAHSTEIETKGFDFGSSSDEDAFNVVFEKMKKECLRNLVKPVLYFIHPADLMEVYETMQKQQLYHFTHVTRMLPQMKTLLMSKEHLKKLIAYESANVASTIESFELLVKFNSDRSNQLEARFFQILNGQFYECVGSPEVFELYLHVEFCYEKVYDEKPIHLDLVVMAKALENLYMDYTKTLENIHSHSVQRAIEQCQAAENSKFKRAKDAARELLFFGSLEKQLLCAFSPKKKTSFMHSYPERFRPVAKKASSKTNKKDSKKDSLTEDEKEYLTLFTVWTENDDPALYLQGTNKAE